MIKKNLLHIFCALTIIFSLLSCENNYMPRPRGYYRIDMPKKEYIKFDSTFPYTFYYPVYTKIVADKYSKNQPYWINIEYPEFKGSIHISYKKINNNLNDYLEDTRTLVMKHIPKATSIGEKIIINKPENVYGKIYNIEGNATASTYQFYLTDSTDNFLRAALYFNVEPNNDSLQPVIDFIKDDIDYFIETFKWKGI